MTEQQDRWWALRAYNSETQYGYGTEAEAEAWADVLNRGREINLYAPEPVEDAEMCRRLDDGQGGVNLADELAGVADLDAEGEGEGEG